MRLVKNFCPECSRDAGGAQRELQLEDGTKCHGCGYEMQKATPYRCDEPCRAALYWKPGGVWHRDGQPPHAEVVCLECGFTGFRFRQDYGRYGGKR